MIAALPTLRDERGRAHRVEVHPNERLLVVAFLGCDCPLARLYVERLNALNHTYAPRGVRFLAVNSNRQDNVADLRRFAAETGLSFPIVKDLGTTTADRLQADRTPQVVVLDESGGVRYRGRIDDQYQVGNRRAEPTAHDLQRALDELLSGRPVSIPETTAAGCLITRRKPAADNSLIYSESIAPLIAQHCASCHRAGGAAPMSLANYDDVADWSAMIAEVVSTRRMPPWPAAGKQDEFLDDLRLTPDEQRLLLDWIGDGCPNGDSNQVAERQPPALAEWSIGIPDLVIAMPVEFVVPATGMVEYQTFDVDPGLVDDRWAAAIEIRPGNPRVVHHCNVFLCPPGSSDVVEAGSLGSVCLAAMAAGTQATRFPPGMAKRIPAGWRLRFVVHYTTTGREERDQTRLGLRLIDAASVEREVATRLLVDHDLHIPPHAANHRVEQQAVVERDLLLLAMFPHLHLRGKSFTYEVVYPNGTHEVLLNVPRWDFNWQLRYALAQPKLLPAGSVLRCVAMYDNSASNPANPDPSVWVRTGQQSADEMFNGYYDVAPVIPINEAWRTHVLSWVRAVAVFVASTWLGGRMAASRATSRAPHTRRG
jgi:hypothetical protein